MTYGNIHSAQHECLIPRASRTSNFLERLRGLLAKPELEQDQGLIIAPCSSVHTIGMGYPIDIIFLDKDWTIVKIVDSLKPWRLVASKAASMVLEMTGGSAQRLNLDTGQTLIWNEDV